MRVAIISGARSMQPMGLELAERRLLAAMHAAPDRPRLDLHVVGGRAARRYARSMGATWHPARPGRMPRAAWRSADVVHLIGLDVPPPPRDPFVATIHDLAAIRFPDEGRLPLWIADIARRAARVVTPSRFTAGELQRQLGVPPDRIRVVPNGPGHPVSASTAPLSTQELAELGLRAPFVLRMGGYTQRKNVPVVLAAWPQVRRETGASLALVGPPQAAREVQLAAAPSLDGVVPLGYLPAPLVPRVLRAASALVSTSTYEGFGLPPLEAMAAGIPVVAVRSGAVEEVCGEAAVLVDDDPAALADGLVGLLTDDELRGRLVAEGLARSALFGWDAAAAALFDVLHEVRRRTADRGGAVCGG